VSQTTLKHDFDDFGMDKHTSRLSATLFKFLHELFIGGSR